MNYFENVLVAVSCILQVAVLFFLTQGPFRKYLFLFIYLASELLSTVAELAVVNLSPLGNRSPAFGSLYWSDEALSRVLEFAMLIALAWRASEGSPKRALIGKLLGAAAIIVVAAPFIFIRQRVFSASWFNGMTEVLYFSDVILNLGLWTALIANHRRDFQLLMVSAGVGIEVTGQALAFSLRTLNSPPTLTAEFTANLLISFSNLLSLFIWFWALRPARRRNPLPTVATNP